MNLNISRKHSLCLGREATEEEYKKTYLRLIELEVHNEKLVDIEENLPIIEALYFGSDYKESHESKMDKAHEEDLIYLELSHTKFRWLITNYWRR